MYPSNAKWAINGWSQLMVLEEIMTKPLSERRRKFMLLLSILETYEAKYYNLKGNIPKKTTWKLGRESYKGQNDQHEAMSDLESAILHAYPDEEAEEKIIKSPAAQKASEELYRQFKIDAAEKGVEYAMEEASKKDVFFEESGDAPIPEEPYLPPSSAENELTELLKKLIVSNDYITDQGSIRNALEG